MRSVIISHNTLIELSEELFFLTDIKQFSDSFRAGSTNITVLVELTPLELSTELVVAAELFSFYDTFRTVIESTLLTVNLRG